GDAGMDSEANQQELARGLGHDMLAMPMGQLTEVQQDVLSRPGRFQQVNDHLEVKEVSVGDGALSSAAIWRRPSDSASTARRSWPPCARNSAGSIPRRLSTPNAPVSWSRPRATAAI